MNQSLKTSYLEIEIAFTGHVPDILKHDIDFETNQFLTNIEIWYLFLKNWINYIKNDSDLSCPSFVRNNNLFSLGLVFSNDSTIKNMNNRWRGKNKNTDVLSFPALDEKLILPPNQFVELGDIFLSVETALTQSKEHKHSLIYELKWLVSHGLLHLLGWEHSSSITLNYMLDVQEKLIKATDNLLLKS